MIIDVHIKCSLVFYLTLVVLNIDVYSGKDIVQQANLLQGSKATLICSVSMGVTHQKVWQNMKVWCIPQK